MTETKTELLQIVRSFLSEFKTERALNQLHLDASIEKDLGIDSLGRVELFLRIEKAFSVQFSDSLMVEANTLNDIFRELVADHPILQTHTKTFVSALELSQVDPLSSSTLNEILQRHAKEEPNRPHVYFQDEQGQEEVLRYGQLLLMASKVAAGLQEKGLKPQETVAIMLPSGFSFFYAFFGTLLAGGIPVPIYPPLRADRIEEYAFREASILNNAEIRILITFDKVEILGRLLSVFIKSLNTVTTVELLLTSKKPLEPFTPQPEDPALIQYTSGSTSDPKGVLLSHQNLLSNIRAFGMAAALSPKDIGVSWLPLYHDMGLIGAWLGSLYHAIPLTLLSPLTFVNRPEKWLWAIHYHRGTISAGPNFAYELCVRKIEEKSLIGLDLSCWRLAFNGAEMVDPKTLERFSKKFKPYGFREENFFPVYGLAESTVALTFPPIGAGPKIDNIQRKFFEEEQRAEPPQPNSTDLLQFVSSGYPLPEHDIRIVNDSQVELRDRNIGSLQFTGPSAMQGYYRNPTATKAIYHEGWWDSGDLAYKVDNEVYITGRKKDVIIKAGRNIYPQELEMVAAEIYGIRKGSVIAFGIPDPKWGTEKLIIVAETAEKNVALRKKITKDIIEKISVVLAIPPDEIVLVPPRSIPKTSSGKLQRALCKRYYQEGKLTRKSLPISLQMVKLGIKGLGVSGLHFLTQLCRLIYTVYIGIGLLLLLPIVFLGTLLMPQNIARAFCKNMTKLLLFWTALPIQITGKENLDSAKPMIYIANHASYFDALLVMSILPNHVIFVGKQELEDWPFMGRIFKKLGFITVDRNDVTQSLLNSQHMSNTLNQGNSLMIFPEGTFTYAVGLRPFKLGAFKMAVETLTPLCPIALEGTRLLLPKNQRLLQRVPIHITILKPLYPENKEWSEVTRLHTVAKQEIANHCGEFILDLVTASHHDE